MRIVVDTSALIQCQNKLDELILENELIITTTISSELDNQKESSDRKRSYNGRYSLRWIEKNEDNLTFMISDVMTGLPEEFELDENNNDNKIISAAIKADASIITCDRGMRIKCKALGIDVVDTNNNNGEEIDLKGYKILEWDCSDEDNAKKLNALAEDDTNNIFDLEINQFCILKDTAQPVFTEDGITDEFTTVAIVQWNGEKTIPLKYKDVNNTFTGKVRPRNIEQKMLFSLMQNDKITVKLCSGGYGSGKDFCMLTNSLELMQKGKYEKIVWFRNPVNVKGIAESGFLPGSWEEKNAPYSAILDDILGDNFGTKMFLESGKLEIGNLGAVRGRTFKNTILFLTEMQNCSTEIIQLLLSRVGEGSILLCNGDFNQIDEVKHNMSSVRETVEVLHGIDKFGYIQLDKVERSETADLARLFDERD